MPIARSTALRFREFLREQEGAAASEYALLLAAIAVAAAGAVAMIGTHVTGATEAVSTGLTTNGPDSAHSGSVLHVRPHAPSTGR